MTKEELRASIRLALKSMPASEMKAESSLIVSRIAAMPDFRAAGTVLAYMPMSLEPDILALFQISGKRFALPKVTGDGLMEFRQYEPSRMESGAYGILEPSSSSPLIREDEIDFAIVPGLAFDVCGHRLGHGKGFYDRVLPALACPCIGVVFSCQMVRSVPVDAWDRKVDSVVTGLRG